MENITVTERLKQLRMLMEEHQIDAYLVPTEDFHSSEYVGDYFKCRKYITGFTGSAGTAVIMKDMAGLWTDGRYFLQAGKQLEGTTITLFRMGEPDVPTIHEFLKEHLQNGMCLGFDGRTVGAKEEELFRKDFEGKEIRIEKNVDLIGDIWKDRPQLPCGRVMELDTCWCGKSRKEKLAELREDMEKAGADVFLLSCLDDIAWLLNIRGNDIECCPVLLSYLIVRKDSVLLFANKKAFPRKVRMALKEDGVEILPYGDVYASVRAIGDGEKVLLSKNRVNSALAGSVPRKAEIIDQENPTLLKKAVKNPVEMDNMRKAHIKDGAAVTKFIFWLKKACRDTEVTELSAAEMLYEFRSAQENFQGNSFHPIIAYGAHGAIIHYSATEETDVRVEPKGLLLADTGGHYLEGTTDITRTIAVGELTEEEKLYFTRVLQGYLDLSDACFRYGCTGLNLDYLARAPLWRMGKDYNHGTGHGVGYFLNVHEAPNGFRWKIVPERNDSAVLEEGMITSDEPGYYVENKFGIRHESLLLCRKGGKTETGQFMCFEVLTMVPFDLDAVEPSLLTERQKELLNQYHEKVREVLSPYMTEEENTWLKEATRKI